MSPDHTPCFRVAVWGRFAWTCPQRVLTICCRCCSSIVCSCPSVLASSPLSVCRVDTEALNYGYFAVALQVVDPSQDVRKSLRSFLQQLCSHCCFVFQEKEVVTMISEKTALHYPTVKHVSYGRNFEPGLCSRCLFVCLWLFVCLFV